MIPSTIRIGLRMRQPHFIRRVPVGANRKISHSIVSQYPTNTLTSNKAREDSALIETEKVKPGHAVISTFDLFSIGVGPSSSHTVGPMRAGKIFITDLQELQMLEKVTTVKIVLYGSLAATGKGHHTPQAILLGLEGSDPETIDTGTISSRYEAILANKTLHLGGKRRIHFDMDRDMLWRWDQVLKTHPNGMRFSCFGEEGELLATNEYFSVGGGFVVNEKTKADENLFYKGVDKRVVHGARLHQTHNVAEGDQTPAQPAANDPGHPPYPFESGNSLLALTSKHNLTIAQIVHDNERYFGLSDADIHDKLMRIWAVMDDCIRSGVSTAEKTLPGRLGLQRRAPMLYKRLMRGFYPGIATPDLQLIGSASTASVGAINAPESHTRSTSNTDGSDGHGEVSASGKTPRAPWVTGSFDHAILPMPPRKTMIPAVDFLSCYAIAVNEVNASGGRIVTSPTNGAAGVIPAVLKYVIEFISDDPEKSIKTFLLTAAAVGMLFKRGSTISAAEGGCQAEVGVACSMASAGFAACMGASPETVLQAAEIGIEHNLGLTCDPIDGLVQVPCIERNSLGAVKAVTAAQLSMASTGVYRVTLDEAIEAMRLTAADMSVKYKETSLSGLATTVKIPLTVPAC
ncbi:serine dehydratase alpha chain-domain-containing protein [Suillus ampliporus]|nr:serine dehydratase alpha chain-domain-containing protein [Suillus ampliporus]